jgi:hypothetical protein
MFRRPSPTLLAAGVLQIAAVFTPAVRIPFVRGILFLRLPTAGVLLVALGLIAVGVAFRPAGWWRWLPSILSGAIVTAAYLRILHAPSGTFGDFLLRRTVHPDWGFVPMGAAVALGLVGAAIAGRDRRRLLDVTDEALIDMPIDTWPEARGVRPPSVDH